MIGVGILTPGGPPVPFFLGFYRRQYFTHPLGEGGMAAYENRHIGPQLKAKSRQLIFRETAAPQMVERHQHGGGIGGATAQSRRPSAGAYRY